MFNMLNQFTVLRNTAARNTPHIVFNVRYKPLNNELTNYEVLLAVRGSAGLTLNFNAITQSANFLGLNGRTFPTPQDASDEVAQAIQEAMRLISREVGNTLSPNLMVKYKNEIFWNGHEILIGKEGDNQITLQPLGKFGVPLSPEQVSWTNASNGVVDMTGLQNKSITLTRLDTAASLTVNIKRRSSFVLDIKTLLRPIVLEVLAEKLSTVLDEIVNTRVDSVNNANSVSALVGQVEAGNVPLEGSEVLVPLFAQPLVLSDSSAFRQTNTSIKARTLRELRRAKAIRQVLRTKVNTRALCNLLIEQPDKLDELLDELLLNSGTLIGELVLNLGDLAVLQSARNIIITYLNENMTRLAGSNFGMANDEPITVTYVQSAAPAMVFDPAKRLYINNPNVDFPGKAKFVSEITTYLNALDTPLYVFVNYSQDLSTETYLKRTIGTRPAGLPPDAQFVTLTLVNIPGSVQYQMYGSKAGVQIDTSLPPEEIFIKYIKDKRVLVNNENELAKILLSVQGVSFLYCKKCEGKVTDLSPEQGKKYKATLNGQEYNCLIGTLNSTGFELTYDIQVRDDVSFRQNPITANVNLQDDQFILIGKSDGSIVPCTANASFPGDFCSLTEVTVDAAWEAQIFNEISKCIDDSDFSGSDVVTLTSENEISYEAIKLAIQNQLANEFFSDAKSAKIGVKLHDQFGNSQFFSTSNISEENVEIKLLIKVDEASRTIKIKNINVSETYLETLVAWLQSEATRRGITVDVEELRQQVITDIEDATTNKSFIDHAFQNLTAYFNQSIGRYVEVAQVTQKTVKHVWDDGQMSQGHWWSGAPDRGKWPTYAELHPGVAGPVDGLIDEIVGIPMAIKSMYGIMTDAQQKEAFAALFTSEGASALIDGIGSEISSTLDDDQKTTHAGGKTVVTVAAMFFTGGITKTGKGLNMLEAMLSSMGMLKNYKKLTAYLRDIKKAVGSTMTKAELDKIKTAFDGVFQKLSQLQDSQIILQRLENLISSIGVKNFSTFIIKLDKLKDIPGLEKVLKDLTVDSDNWRKFIGAKFVIDYVSNKGDDFIKKITRFEEPTEILVDGISRGRVYDMVADGVRYEFKNWKNFYPSTIRSQFVADLANASFESLGQFKWVFNKTSGMPDIGTLKTSVLNALKKADGSPVDELGQLSLDRTRQLLGDDFGVITEANKGKKLLEAMSEDGFFANIFEVAN
jgi:hypothetical protein